MERASGPVCGHFTPLSMYTPHFSETEKTAAQRSESVKFAVGVTMSQNATISPELQALYKRYIAGEIDIAYLDAQLGSMYPQVPTDDPRYQAGQPTARYYPEPVEPAEPTESAPYLVLDQRNKRTRERVLE